MVERKRERVFWIAYHVVGDHELARDVAQEVFLRLFRVMRRFRSGGRFDAWLYRITLNLGIDALRRERPHREAVPLESPGRGDDAGTAGAPGAAVEPAAPGAAGGRSPTGETLRQREVRGIFVTLCALLTPKMRMAFILREIEGLPTYQVAAIMKTRASTIRNHVLQARRILQEEMRRRYPEYCVPSRPDRA
ncbi:MAG: hypothetical protein DMF50_02185 [Acidobacteria bacterium]|nr:MAG: hypothetical protein DMF50_02185 [Acidobacteriota bacterium]